MPRLAEHSAVVPVTLAPKRRARNDPDRRTHARLFAYSSVQSEQPIRAMTPCQELLTPLGSNVRPRHDTINSFSLAAAALHGAIQPHNNHLLGANRIDRPVLFD
jgi:hypothetical protein